MCDSVSSPLQPFHVVSFLFQERSLVKSLKQFTDNSWRLMMKYREVFPATDKGKLGRLINLLE